MAMMGSSYVAGSSELLALLDVIKNPDGYEKKVQELAARGQAIAAAETASREREMNAREAERASKDASRQAADDHRALDKRKSTIDAQFIELGKMQAEADAVQRQKESLIKAQAEHDTKVALLEQRERGLKDAEAKLAAATQVAEKREQAAQAKIDQLKALVTSS